MDTGPAPVGIRRKTLAREVRAELERLIVTGDIEAGAKLNEAVLANAMGVSRGTVREAIRSLADSGLIDLVANRGAFVHRLTLDDVRDLYDLRGAIFAMACAALARRVAERGDDRVIAALRQNLAEMREAQQRDDRPAYYTLNIAFHDRLLDAADNARAKEIYDALVKEMHLFRRRGLSIAMNVARSVVEHEAIVVAIEQGDATAARAAAIAHIEGGLERYTRTLSSDGVDGVSNAVSTAAGGGGPCTAAGGGEP